MNISESDRHDLFNTYFETPSIRHCRQLLFNRIFSNSLTIRKESSDDDENFNVTPEFQVILNKYYTSLARSILDDFFIFGYSHYFIDQIKLENGQKISVPKKMPFGTYTVKMEITAFGGTTLEFIPRDKKEKQYTVYPIIFEKDILPAYNGKHRSIVSTLVQPNHYLHMLKKFNLQSEYLRAFPKMFLRHNTEGISKPNSKNDFSKETLVENEIIELKQRQRNYLALESAKQVEEAQQKDEQRKRFVFENETVFLDEITDNRFILPVGMDLANPISQNLPIRNDLLDFEIQRNRLILESFGIPSSFVSGKDVSLKSNGGANKDDNLNFFKTVVGYTRILQQILQEVYNSIYPENTDEFVVIVLENDYISIDTIIKLASEGAISDDEKKNLLLVRCGLR